jgi:hypothetical protein
VLNLPQRRAPEPAPPVHPDDRRRILQLSDERARWRQRVAAAFRSGYRAAASGAWRDGFEAGYRAAEADELAARRSITRQVLTRPADGWQQRLRAAEADAARAATAQWDGFLARAHATPAQARTDVQRAVVGGGLRPAL